MDLHGLTVKYFSDTETSLSIVVDKTFSLNLFLISWVKPLLFELKSARASLAGDEGLSIEEIIFNIPSSNFSFVIDFKDQFTELLKASKVFSIFGSL